MTARTCILLGADVRCLDERDQRAEAIALADGRIVAVGTRARVLELAGPDAERHDLGGATVLPGFIDTHQHPALSVLYGGLVQLAPPTVTDVASLQGALARAAATLDDERWLVARGWDESLLSERRPPTLAELDAAVPDRPLMALHYTCHRVLANSRALELAGIGAHTPDPAGGAISRGRGGAPDGLLIERGMSRVESLARASVVARDGEGFLDRLVEHQRALVAVGITRVVDAAVPGDLAALYREAAHRGRLVLPTVLMPVSTGGFLELPFDALDGRATGDEDGPLSVGPLKLVFDGGQSCAMCLGWLQMAGTVMRAIGRSLARGSLDPLRAAMSVSPRLGAQIRTGITLCARGQADEIVRAATSRGFAIAIHAAGNAAVDVALDAFREAGADLAHAGMPRLEHAMFLDPTLVARIADSGAAVIAQPHFLSIPAIGDAPSIVGLRTKPLRWLLDAGVTVAGSSDHPGAGFDPLDGVRTAVTRLTRAGRVHEPDQRIALDEALTMYTRTAARVLGCLDRCGTLEVGKRADLVVLDGPLSVGSLATARVRATLIGGELRYGRLPRG